MEALTIGDCCICGEPQESGTQCAVCKAIWCDKCEQFAEYCQGCGDLVCAEHLEFRDSEKKFEKLCSTCRRIED